MNKALVLGLSTLLFVTPVIAFKQGGIKEIVTPGITGEFFVSKTREVLSEAVLRFTKQEQHYSYEAMQEKAQEFSSTQFREHIKKAVEESYDYYSRT